MNIDNVNMGVNDIPHTKILFHLSIDNGTRILKMAVEIF